MSNHVDSVVDVATTFDRKVRAVREHTSQFGKHPDVEGLLRRISMRAGGTSDRPFVEGFKRLNFR
jgi:hypothetical protein